jgi:DNA-binding response OmpR family regulator
MSTKTILVVEDSRDLAESIKDALELSGFQVIVALSGKDGTSLALTHHPDLILLDIKLPDTDGYHVYREIRNQGAWGETAKVIILTASESLNSIAKNIALPVGDILFKPDLSISGLVENIKNRLA